MNSVSHLDPQSIFRMDLLDRRSKKSLLKDLNQLHSFSVCDIVKTIGEHKKELQIEQVVVTEQYHNLEETKEKLTEECRSMFETLLAHKEKLMDEKRELGFCEIMADEQMVRAVAREEKRLEEMRHKIDVQKLGQQKVKQESKFLIYNHL